MASLRLRYPLLAAVIVLSLFVLAPIPEVSASTSIAAEQYDTATKLTTRIFVPENLNSVDEIILIQLKASNNEQPEQLTFRWAQGRGFIRSWTIDVASDAGVLPGLYVNRRTGTESIGTLSTVWPKPGVWYEANLVFSPNVNSVSFSLCELEDRTPIVATVLTLQRPLQNFQHALVASNGTNSSNVQLPSDSYSQLVVEKAVYEGTPFELLRDFSMTLGRLGVQKSDTTGAIVLSEKLQALLTWPDSKIPGIVRFELVSDEGDRHTLGIASADMQPQAVLLDLASISPGNYRVEAVYVNNEIHSIITECPLTVISGVMQMAFASLVTPAEWSVTSPDIEWHFASTQITAASQETVSPISKITGVISAQTTHMGTPTPATLEVWAQESAAGTGTWHLLSTQPLEVTPGSEAGLPFEVAIPTDISAIRLVLKSEAPSISSSTTKPVELRRNPMQWRLPQPDPTKAAAGFAALPEASHFDVFQSDPKVGTYNHHSQIFHHSGTFFASWSNHVRDEDARAQRVLGSLSTDGVKWSAPIELFPPFDVVGMVGDDGYYLTAQLHNFLHSWVVVDRSVYAIAHVMEWREGKRLKVGEIAREVHQNGTLGPIFWLNADPPSPVKGFPRYPDLGDPAFTELGKRVIEAATPIPWQNYVLQAADGHGIVELTHFTRTDGSKVLLGRDKGRLMYASASFDGGVTWSQMMRTTIPDSPSLANAGMLPDGTVFLVHNPARARDPLVLSLSRDGVSFTEAWAVRADAPPLRYTGTYKARGYQYPSAVTVGANLFIIYSVGKEDIAVSRIPLRSLSRAR